jgi:hypothetical protein
MTTDMSGQNIVTPSAENIAASVSAATQGKGLPPVHLWNPPFCGDLDIRIARDGTWFYLGTPIGRPALVKLFSSILKREAEKYYLVTPVEKVGIQVDDAPFVAVDVDHHDGNLHFTTQVGDTMIAGPNHPIRVERDAKTGEPSPYVLVRSNLEALIDRKSFYRLVDLGSHDTWEGESWFGLRSQSTFFPMIPSRELNN